jgi:hypothetical protein
VAATEGNAIVIANENFAALSLLGAEFGFEALNEKLSEFKASPAFRAMPDSEDAEANHAPPPSTITLAEWLLSDVVPSIATSLVGFHSLIVPDFLSIITLL